MSKPLQQQQIDKISQYDSESRYQYLIKEIVKNDQIWLLTDEHGCVMLNSDNEDCVPIWPNQEFAQLWASEEWSHCNAHPVSLSTWQERWTHGLEDDELAIVVFPTAESDGFIFFPDEFAEELNKQIRKQKNRK